MLTIAVSMASWFSIREARAAIKTTVSASTPLANTWENNQSSRSRYRLILDRNTAIGRRKETSIRFLSTVSLFSVRVPVLSLQRTSIPAISSIAVILLVIAPCYIVQACFQHWNSTITLHKLTKGTQKTC